MPSVVACQPDGVAVADLRGPGRMSLAGVTWQGSPAFALAWRYPPNPAALMRPDGVTVSLASFGVMALIRAPMAVAQHESEVQRVAEAAMQGGTVEAANQRLTEAMELFKNLPRVRQEVLASCIADAVTLLQAYWQIREWLAAGCSEKTTVEACSHRLVLLP
jgi:hypothetical protein